MPATLAFPTATPTSPVFQNSYNLYEQVAVCPDWSGMDYLVAPVRQAPPANYWHFSRPAPRATPAAEDLRAQWLLKEMLKDGETVRQQLLAKQEYFEGIEARYVLKAAYLLSLVLRHEATLTQLAFTLTYDQSLHLRAALPQGALHASVLFTPGLDPTQHLGQCEEEDNTVVSVFGPDGHWRAGTEGSLLPCLERLPALLAAPATLGLS